MKSTEIGATKKIVLIEFFNDGILKSFLTHLNPNTCSLKKKRALYILFT